MLAPRGKETHHMEESHWVLLPLAYSSFGEYFQDRAGKNNVSSPWQGSDMLMKVLSEKTKVFDLVAMGAGKN